LLFRLVKLVGDFENMAYVLAFDDEVVAAALSRRYPEQEEMGEGFLEKIIQVPLHLPAARLDLVHNAVFEGIDQLFNSERVELSQEDVYRFRSAFDSNLGPEINTPRDASRYVNAVRFAIPTLKGEVNPVDALLLEGIRVTMPLLYRWVSTHKDLLTLSNRGVGVSGPSTEVREALDAGFARIGANRAARAKALVSELFPRTQGIWGNTSWGGDWDETWSRQKRVASRSYFDRFFMYALPPDDVSDASIDRLVNEAGVADDDLALILGTYTIGSTANVVLDKLRQRVGDVSSKRASTLIGSLATVGQDFDFDRSSAFGLSTGEQAALLVNELLLRVSDEKDRAAIAFAFAQVAEPMKFAAEVVRWSSLSRSSEAKPGVDDGTHHEMVSAVVSRIIETNSHEPLSESDPEWAARLYLLAIESPSADKLRDDISSTINTPAAAAAFVRCFLNRGIILNTGTKTMHPLDSSAYGALVSVVDSALLEQVFADEGWIPEEGSTDPDDMIGADDFTVAKNFMRQAGRSTKVKDTEQPGGYDAGDRPQGRPRRTSSGP
jgi:hypothetical protein